MQKSRSSRVTTGGGRFVSYHRHKKLIRQEGLLSLALSVALLFIFVAVGVITENDPLVFVLITPPLFLGMFFILREFKRRQERKLFAQDQIAALGFASDVEGILTTPERLEAIRDIGRRVHVTRYVQMSASEAGVSTKPIWICAVELNEGDLVELESGPAASIEASAEQLARALALPLVDFTYGAPIERRL